MSSGPMAAMVWEGPSVVHTSRAMIQHTNLAEAAPSPIWRDYGVYISRTTTPSSHSVEGTQREIQLRQVGDESKCWANCAAEGPK
uniref:nucleoside-diphosphate kinase n=1 Tax=Phocoena sinus TaxID=42100 RepID=A0A8C9B6B2_PHOSS